MRRAVAAPWLTTLLALAQPAQAQDVTFNLGVQSDYVFRGISQTREEPGVFAGVDATLGRGYAGAWVSNVDFPGDPDTNAEVDLYGGWRTTRGAWTFDVGAVAYLYANQPNGADYDYVEAKVAASRTQGPWTLGAIVYASPDFAGAAEDEAFYLEGNAAVKLTPRLSVSGALGRQSLSSDLDYTAWNAGVTFNLTDQIALDVRGWDTDEHGFGEIYGSRVVAAVKATF